jgi:hypothetical protein
MPSLQQVQDAVNKQYNLTTNTVDQSIAQVQVFLSGLQAIIAGLALPAISAPQGLFLPAPIDVNAPQPTRPDTDFTLPAEPAPFQVADINVANIPPIDPITLPQIGAFSYAERDYVSPLNAAMVAKLIDYVINGSDGLDPKWEQDMIDRNLTRDEKMNQLEIEKLSDVAAAFGWDLPQGSLKATVDKVLMDYYDKKEDQSLSIFIKQFESSFQNNQFSLTTSVQYESMMIAHFEAIEGRALQAARSVTELGIAIYNAYVARYNEYLAAIKMQMEVSFETARIQTQVESLQLQVFLGNVQLYKTNVDAILEKIRTLASVYGVDIQKYSADISVSEAKGRIIEKQQEFAQADLEANLRMALEASKTNLQAYIELANIQVHAATSGGQIWSQTVAGALNAINTLVHMADSGLVNQTQPYTVGG